jgi:hypothetical protein
MREYWNDYVGGLPILVQMMSYNTDRVGNHLGTYFNDIACAAQAGLHFIGVHYRYESHGVYHHYDAFWNALPTLIEHHSPVAYDNVVNSLYKECPCGGYCWDAGDPWVQQLPLIRSIMTTGLHLHLASHDHHGVQVKFRGMRHSKEKDMIYPEHLPESTYLPMFPDVAIHYRCSDNLYGGMGLMSIGTLINHIPPESKYIYIFTESHARVLGSPLAHTGVAVLTKIMNDLKAFFPNAIIVIMRGGNEFTVWSQLAFANVTICSPSTFCLWPAVARTGLTYMPTTPYVAHNKNKPDQWADLGPNFRWIRDPHLYNNFTDKSTIKEVLDTISMDIPKLHRNLR